MGYIIFDMECVSFIIVLVLIYFVYTSLVKNMDE